MSKALVESEMQQFIKHANDEHQLDAQLWTRTGFILWCYCRPPEPTGGGERLQTWVKLFISSMQHVELMCSANGYCPGTSGPSIVALTISTVCPTLNIRDVVAPMCSQNNRSDDELQEDDDEGVPEVTCKHCKALHDHKGRQSRGDPVDPHVHWGSICSEYPYLSIAPESVMVVNVKQWNNSSSRKRKTYTGLPPPNYAAGHKNQKTLLLGGETHDTSVASEDENGKNKSFCNLSDRFIDDFGELRELGQPNA